MFFRNRELSHLPYSTRLLFVGLWTLADKSGVLLDHPGVIKASIFPWDAVDIDKALADLHIAGAIVRYISSGMACISICNWEQYQNPHTREPRGTLPKPPNAIVVPVAEARKPATPLDRFLAFWDAYPNKVRKDDAARAWLSVIETDSQASEAMECLDRWKKSLQWSRGMVPFPAKWLMDCHANKWADSPLEVSVHDTRPKPQLVRDEAMERAKRRMTR